MKKTAPSPQTPALRSALPRRLFRLCLALAPIILIPCSLSAADPPNYPSGGAYPPPNGSRTPAANVTFSAEQFKNLKSQIYVTTLVASVSLLGLIGAAAGFMFLISKSRKRLTEDFNAANATILEGLQLTRDQLGGQAQLAADLNRIAPDLRAALGDVKRNSVSLSERLSHMAAREESIGRTIAQLGQQAEESKSSRQILDASISQASSNLALLSQRAQSTASTVGALELKVRDSERAVMAIRDTAINLKAPIERLSTVQTQLESAVTALTHSSGDLTLSTKEAAERVQAGHSLLLDLSRSIPGVNETCRVLGMTLQKYESVLGQGQQFTDRIATLTNDLYRALNEERKAARDDRDQALKERVQMHLDKENVKLEIEESKRLKIDAETSMKKQQDQSAAWSREQQSIEAQRARIQAETVVLQAEREKHAEQRRTLEEQTAALAQRETGLAAREAAAARGVEEAAEAISKAGKMCQLAWPKVFSEGQPLEQERRVLETRLLQGDAGVMALFGSLIRLKAALALPVPDPDALASLLKETSEEAIKLWKPAARSAAEVAQRAQQWADAFAQLLPQGWKLRVPQLGANKDNEWMTYRIDPSSPFVKEIQNWCVCDDQGVFRQKARVI